jgi:serine/threonine protein kinase/tetratricopeptide (TPR) repeat protein
MSDSPASIPRKLADFEVLRRLGVGGMAEVFLAKKRGAEGTFKLLVLKRILPQFGSSRRFRTMFAEEAQLATRLNHPNIVQVYEFQDYGDEGQLLSMEYVEGPDLRRVMRAARAKHKRMSAYVSAYIIGEVAKGLHYAHERKDERGNPMAIVHRDVSPQNILVSFDGGVKIADFGIASANLFREEPGVLKGKTGYMSPEQARGEHVDRRTDIYSLGVVFHEALTGRHLHGAAEGQELLEAVRSGQVEPPSMYVRDVPPQLDAIVMRALARDPDERYQTARDYAAAITRALFQSQQPIDSHTLENELETLVSREHTSPGAAAPAGEAVGGDDEPGREPLVPNAMPTTHGGSTTGSHGSDPDIPAHHPRRMRRGQEVRHVVIVSLQLHGVEQLAEVSGPSGAGRFIEQLRNTLNEIAYKRSARLTWHRDRALMGEHLVPSGGATALVGLMANPARAPADAAWLAVDIHEAIQGACDDMPVELQASIGIVRGIATGRRDHAGHLVGHVIQEPAMELARMLGQKAPAGGTWVAGGLYRLVRRDFVWADAPTIALDSSRSKNMPDNMRIYALVRSLTREEKAQEAARGSGDLIGRDAELADLQAAFHRAVSRPPDDTGPITVRVVSGEMGIGKSALVSSFVSELPDDTIVVRAECSPARSEVPYTLLAEWLRALTEADPDEGVDGVRAHLAQLIQGFDVGEEREAILDRLSALIAGQFAAAIDEGDAAQNRRLLTAGLRAFIARRTLQSPVLLIGESLQWSDPSSLEAIQDLLRWSEPWPVLVLLVARPGERVSPFLDGLVHVELKELSMDNQVRLLQTRLGASRGVEQVCADIIPRIGGNPFFLLEMVDALLERGVLELRETDKNVLELAPVQGVEVGAQSLPSTLEQLVADRLEELPPEEQAIVDWLAVAGGPLRLDVMRALVGPQVDEGITRLCARGVCSDGGDVVDVRHPVTRDVAYSSLDSEMRVDMHRRLGEQLSQTPLARGLTAAIVARHLEAGHARQAAADFYLEAGRTAHSSYQVRLAKRYFRRAVRLLPENDSRCFEAFEALEAICRVQGLRRERKRHLVALRSLARDSGKARWATVALMRTARFEVDIGHLARALTAAQRAEHLAQVAELAVDQVQAQALVAEILRDLGDMQGALAAIDRALAASAHPEVSARQRAEVLGAKGTLLRRVGRVQEAIDAHAEAIAVFRRVGAKRMEAHAKNSLAFALYALGHFEDAIALGIDAIRIDLSIGGRLQIAKTLSTIGQAYAALGDIDRGLAYFKRARQAHENYHDQDSKSDTLLCWAEALIERGGAAEADQLLQEATAINLVTGSAYDAAHEKIVRALLARTRGDAAAAVMHAFDARQVAEAQAYVAFHFYAMAIEAVSRVDIGEQHTGILLATTTLGAMETIAGSEYALASRALCCEALKSAGSPQAQTMIARGVAWLQKQCAAVKNPDMRRMLRERTPAARLLAWAEGTDHEFGAHETDIRQHHTEISTFAGTDTTQTTGNSAAVADEGDAKN